MPPGDLPLGTGQPPYGLVYRESAEVLPTSRIVRRTARYAENPATIGVVRCFFAESDAGKCLRAICQGLMDDGILPPFYHRTGGTTWGPASLRRILLSRTYIGECAAYRHVTDKAPAVKGPSRKVKRVKDRPEAERVRLPDGCAPVVIDPAVVARVGRRLRSAPVVSPWAARASHL